MSARTTAQRMAVLDAAVWMVGNLDLSSESGEAGAAVGAVLEDLLLYRSWDDRVDDSMLFYDLHERVSEGFVLALALVSTVDTVSVLVDAHAMVAELWDSVPWPRTTVRDRVVGAVGDGLSIMWWADRVASLPRGDVRDLAAYLLDAAHLTAGRHDSGDECQAVVGAFSDGETTVVHRLVQPAYLWVTRWLPV